MTKIIADTTSGLPLDMAAQLGIPVIPQIVIFGEQSFRDDTELTTGISAKTQDIVHAAENGRPTPAVVSFHL